MRTPLGGSSRGDLLFKTAKGIETAELCFEVCGPIHSFHSHRRIQLKRPPRDLRWYGRKLRKGALQSPLPNVTPGTNHIRIDVDVQRLVHAKCPILPA
jgi:hypothetical protein